MSESLRFKYRSQESFAGVKAEIALGRMRLGVPFFEQRKTTSVWAEKGGNQFEIWSSLGSPHFPPTSMEGSDIKITTTSPLSGFNKTISGFTYGRRNELGAQTHPGVFATLNGAQLRVTPDQIEIKGLFSPGSVHDITIQRIYPDKKLIIDGEVIF